MFLGALIKQYILFEIFLQFSTPLPPPPTLQCNIETLKDILDTGVQRCLWGWGRGWGMCELKKILTN